MNLPRYKFSKEVESDLGHFLELAEQKSRNKNCDLKKYELWSKLFPLDPNLINKMEKNEGVGVPIIDLCSSDEEMLILPSEIKEEPEIDCNDESTISDIVFVIKENLQTQNNLSDIVKEHLGRCKGEDLENLLKMLEESLDSKEVYYFGVSNFMSEEFLVLFCRNLLLPKVKQEYCDKLSDLLVQLSKKYLSILEKECNLVLQQIASEERNTFLQYMTNLSLNFQSVLVRDFIFSLEKLDEPDLVVIGTLLNNEVDFQALSKFVEMLSNIAEDHTSDKNFGKLLMTVVETSGPNLVHLEQPLKHIISGHKSVWKAKLEKTFTTCYEDSMMFTQSFRD